MCCLQGLMEGLLSSSAFAKLISKLTTLAMAARTGEVRRFRPGALAQEVALKGTL